MKKRIFLVFASLFLLFSISLSTTNLLAKTVAACYFCMNDGEPENSCAQSSGSGWTHCMSGNLHCALGGNPCMSE